jgi:hypothetical protein
VVLPYIYNSVGGENGTRLILSGSGANGCTKRTGKITTTINVKNKNVYSCLAIQAVCDKSIYKTCYIKGKKFTRSIEKSFVMG